MFASVTNAFNWFINGLVDVWSLLEGRNRRRMTLVRSGDGYAVEQPNGQRSPDLLRLEAGADGPEFQPPELVTTLRNRDIDIVVPADEVLVRTLDPLPGESRQYLDSIVQHQLERVAPWRTDDVLHAYRMQAAESGADRVVVTVIATARSMHERILNAVRALQPREVRLLCRDDAFEGGAVPIPVDRGAGAASRQLEMRRSVIIGLAVLAVVIIGGGSLLGWTLYRTDDEVDAVTEQVATLRHKLLASRAPTSAGDQDLKSLVERRAHTPFVVLALDELSSALPDDTWLSELRLAEGRLRMTGISRNVAGLVPTIEGTPGFTDATFFAPTTRLPGSQGDRFHLEARLVVADRRKP